MQIQWTKGAENNLKHIESYISEENPRATIETLLKIIKSVEALSDHPAMGRIGRVFNTRELIINGTPFIVPYRVRVGHIEILRVLHSSMQWPESL